MLKAGANETDKVQIVKLAEEGHSAGKIASMLLIEEQVVQSFMPAKAKAKAKAKPTDGGLVKKE